MATVLDIGLVQSFDVLYPVIFVFAILFAILQKTRILGENLTMNAIISVAVSLMVLLSRTAIDIINFMVPWFIIAMIFFILVILIFQVFGASDSDIVGYMKGDKGVGWTIIGVAALIFVAALGNVIGQDLTDQAFVEEGTVISEDGTKVASTNFDQNIRGIFFNPKVLGFVTLMIIIIFAVGLLTGNFG